jgi:ATP-binding cassette, subfamily A (ABC1), member 3
VPKKYGKSYSCCFCLKKSYWCKGKDEKTLFNRVSTKPDSSKTFIDQTTEFETTNMDKECYEKVSVSLAQLEQDNRFMKIQNLVKTYANKVRAVSNINLKMYADQIFVLLGHNGAGKTSVISILTGLYKPTEGQAEVFGCDVFNDFDSVR